MNYKSLISEYESLLTGRWLTDLANTSAFLMCEIPRINWVGFYFKQENKLFLGPFQGKPACTEIDFSRGVCGKAARTEQIIVVKDVHDFPDHIVCDVASRSEMVIPLILNNELIGVLDIDSSELDRFDVEIQKFFINIVEKLLAGRKQVPLLIHL